MSEGNVCSRRVHDGYATIRSRGRPRAVYRSDSEELLKEAGGPYALPRLSSNFRVIGEDARQVPRWAPDPGRSRPPIENYGTLRVGRSQHLEEPPRVTLETFSRNTSARRSESSALNAPQADLQLARAPERAEDHRRHRTDVNLCDNHDGNYGWKAQVYTRYGRKELPPNAGERRAYETVPTSRTDPTTLKPFCVVGRTAREKNAPGIGGGGKRLPARDCSRESTCARNVKNDLTRDTSKSDSRPRNVPENARREITKDRGPPIYAVPNNLAFAKSRRDRRTIVPDGNYVPSGDLYRTTAKYIEDINRNLAEIDKSYEQLKTDPRAYGIVAGKIARNDLSRNLYSYARKRDMAPMPPIIVSTDLDDTQTVEGKSGESVEYLRKPNSRGKLPPKVLPRSSSIENTSRHSTGSTTASSSKSTESLYAISESLTELPDTRQPINSSRGEEPQQRLSPEGKSDDRALLETADESKDETSSTSDDDPSASMTTPRSPLERSSVIGAIRRNRWRGDREAADGKRISAKREQTTRSLKDRLVEDPRRCGTLPSRKPRTSSRRPLHKSSEDILDGDKTSGLDRTHLRQRSCSSTADVSHGPVSVDEDLQRGPVYTADATEVILNGQMERSGRKQSRDYFSTRRPLDTTKKRPDKLQYDGFATLPRRGNLSKDQPDLIRRFSGNAPVLEPLYEHAVSDPVKPREIQNVIPWWELATRKYRHRSCPSLQVN